MYVNCRMGDACFVFAGQQGGGGWDLFFVRVVPFYYHHTTVISNTPNRIERPAHSRLSPSTLEIIPYGRVISREREFLLHPGFVSTTCGTLCPLFYFYHIPSSLGSLGLPGLIGLVPVTERAYREESPRGVSEYHVSGSRALGVFSGLRAEINM